MLMEYDPGEVGTPERIPVIVLRVNPGGRFVEEKVDVLLDRNWKE